VVEIHSKVEFVVATDENLQVVRLQPGGTVVVMEEDVEIVRVGDDPFGRGEPTVFYRDWNINSGREVFYLWVSHWKTMYPHIKIPKV
jgi:hypothetical protein